MKLRNWVVITLLPVLLAGAAAILFILRIYRVPPQVVGVRYATRGAIVQRITCQPSYTRSIPLPSPEGSFPAEHYTYRFFLDEQN